MPLIMYINKKRFPFELPIIILDTSKQKYVPNIPHISSDGYICYLDKEGIVWSDDTEKVLDFIFERIESIFFQNESIEGIHREFQYYISEIPNKEYAYSYISESSEARRVKLCIDNKSKRKFFFDSNDIKDEKIDKKQFINAIYIPFLETLDIYVPNKQKFWSAKEISELVKRCVLRDNIELIRRLTKENNQSYYLLDIMLKGNQNVLIGLKYDNKSSKEIVPILDADDDSNITPIYIERVDDKKALVRGGAITNGDEFKILVIGCGSIGSDTIFQLTRSGFKNITIVDKDFLSQNNIYRHFLGKSRGEKNTSKVKLMKKELENRYDELNIQAYDSNIFDMLEKEEIRLDEYSLVISAIGDVNSERLLNKYIIKAKVPVIYTWVEAYGIAGHAVFINKKGCYNCLFTEELMCKVNFAGKSDVPYVKNFGGCLGTYTPYGSMDSMQTAIMATKLAHNFLINHNYENRVFSWKGNIDNFLHDGYLVSDSFYNFNSALGERDDVKLEGCVYCND
nr:ThiF family adenylyltransferase [Clostridium sp. C8]